MDAEFHFDLGEIVHSIAAAEVIAIYFPLIRKTLLADLRTDGADGPMLRVVPMARSIEERFRVLKEMRPHLPRPESITLIPWPKYVESLGNLGVLNSLERRLRTMGFDERVSVLEVCYAGLLQAEQEHLQEAVRGGERFRTLWEARSAP